MTARDWWIGVTVVVLASLLHAAVPRYTWIVSASTDTIWWSRADRWTGRVDVWRPAPEGRLRRVYSQAP